MDHWLEEWDSCLHRDCILPFLKTDEGQIVIEHGHTIIARNKDGVLLKFDPKKKRLTKLANGNRVK